MGHISDLKNVKRFVDILVGTVTIKMIGVEGGVFQMGGYFRTRRSSLS